MTEELNGEIRISEAQARAYEEQLEMYSRGISGGLVLLPELSEDLTLESKVAILRAQLRNAQTEADMGTIRALKQLVIGMLNSSTMVISLPSGRVVPLIYNRTRETLGEENTRAESTDQIESV